MNRISRVFGAVRQCVRGASALLYNFAFGAFTAGYLLSRVRWAQGLGIKASAVQKYSCIAAVLLLGAAVLAGTARKAANRAAAACITVSVTLLVYVCGLYGLSWFLMTVSLLLVLFSAGKRFRTLVLVMLVSTLGVLALAGVGLGAGFTYEESKVGTYGTGYGLGMIHANTWGLLAAQALFLGWYLFLRKSRPWMVCGLFWAAGIFLVLVPKCRTAALMLFLFPVISILLKRMLTRPEGAAPSFPRELLRWFLVLTPLTCFLLTAFLGIEREWLVRHTFGTYIENFSKRFIQAGIAFKRYGFPLLGTAVDLKSEATEKLAGIRIPLYVLDNGYAYYGITRGMVWLVPALGFLCCANHLAIRRRDYAVLSLSVIFSLTALMERVGLDVWYNCVLLFPLSAAAAGGEAGTLPVPEPGPPGPEPPGSGAEEC